MAIYAVTGKPRHGKTYFLARQMVRWLQNGERIYSNVKLKNLEQFKLALPQDQLEGDLYSDEDLANEAKQIFYWRHTRDWNRMTKGIIIADEGTRYFNPRRWAMLSEETEIKLQQHGKEDLDIWTTTQHFTRLDVTMRVLVERFFVVEKIFGPTGNSLKARGICKITEHYLEDMEKFYNAPAEDKVLHVVGTQYMFIRSKYAKVYDTRQMVGHSDPGDMAHHEIWCKNPDCPVHGRNAGKPKISHTI